MARVLVTGRLMTFLVLSVLCATQSVGAAPIKLSFSGDRSCLDETRVRAALQSQTSDEETDIIIDASLPNVAGNRDVELKVEQRNKVLLSRRFSNSNCQALTDATVFVLTKLFEPASNKPAATAATVTPKNTEKKYLSSLAFEAGIRSGLNITVAPQIGVQLSFTQASKRMFKWHVAAFIEYMFGQSQSGPTLLTSHILAAKIQTCPLQISAASERLLFPFCVSFEAGTFLLARRPGTTSIGVTPWFVPLVSIKPQYSLLKERLFLSLELETGIAVIRPKVTDNTGVLIALPRWVFGATAGIGILF